jgi:ABC-type uncharacterized transport system ATPase subunit
LFPEDRLGMGLVGEMGMVENMMLRSYENGKTPFLRYQEPSALAEDIKKKLAVNTPSVKTPGPQTLGRQRSEGPSRP